MTNARMKSIAFWTTTVFGPSSFVIGGVLILTGNEQATAGLLHLGYPQYFGLILGTWKLLGAIAITLPGVPRLKEWAYAGFFFDLTAAAVSHMMVGDSASDVAEPIVFLALVAASWALRPASRRLVVPGTPSIGSRVGSRDWLGGSLRRTLPAGV
jgi:hypothetical protein